MKYIFAAFIALGAMFSISARAAPLSPAFVQTDQAIATSTTVEKVCWGGGCGWGGGWGGGWGRPAWGWGGGGWGGCGCCRPCWRPNPCVQWTWGCGWRATPAWGWGGGWGRPWGWGGGWNGGWGGGWNGGWGGGWGGGGW